MHPLSFSSTCLLHQFVTSFSQHAFHQPLKSRREQTTSLFDSEGLKTKLYVNYWGFKEVVLPKTWLELQVCLSVVCCLAFLLNLKKHTTKQQIKLSWDFCNFLTDWNCFGNVVLFVCFCNACRNLKRPFILNGRQMNDLKRSTGNILYYCVNRVCWLYVF